MHLESMNAPMATVAPDDRPRSTPLPPKMRIGTFGVP
jgi:hypothetical protein